MTTSSPTPSPTPSPTSYPTVNAALADLAAQIRDVLGTHLSGIYLTGSLALGDFDPTSSDIDLIVVTAAPLAAGEMDALRGVHERFSAGDSPWADKIEVVYAPYVAITDAVAWMQAPDAPPVPQVEKDRGFVLDRLEDGWLAQCTILREHGVTLTGPSPRAWIKPVDPDALRRTMAQIPRMWQRDAADPTWLEWVRRRPHQAFVVLTLCRLLYTLATGEVASKPAAARWAQAALGDACAGLASRALAGQHTQEAASEADVAATLALIAETVRRFDAWEQAARAAKPPAT